MYAIRVEATRPVMRIELSQRLTADEALRAMSQGFALAEAGSVHGVLCDLRRLQRGPGQLLIIAAALASRYPAGMRLAFFGLPDQIPLVRRVARFSGVREGIACVTTVEDAEAWVDPPVVAATQPRLSATARRHAEDLLRPAPAMERHAARERAKQVGPAA